MTARRAPSLAPALLLLLLAACLGPPPPPPAPVPPCFPVAEAAAEAPFGTPNVVGALKGKNAPPLPAAPKESCA